MLGIERVDHIGIRVSDKGVSIAFYERLGFETLSDTGFEQGHPVILRHPSGVVLNLLGPSNTANDRNILMDVEEKYPGITHVSFKVGTMEATRRFLAEQGIPQRSAVSSRTRSVLVQGPAGGVHPRPGPKRHRARRVRGRGARNAGRRREFRIRAPPLTGRPDHRKTCRSGRAAARTGEAPPDNPLRSLGLRCYAGNARYPWAASPLHRSPFRQCVRTRWSVGRRSSAVSMSTSRHARPSSVRSVASTVTPPAA